jgi:hypothetical protein
MTDLADSGTHPVIRIFKAAWVSALTEDLSFPSMNSKHSDDLVSAAQYLAEQCRDAARSGPGLSDTPGILAAVDRVQSSLFQLEPAAFLQRVADQVWQPTFPPLTSEVRVPNANVRLESTSCLFTMAGGVPGAGVSTPRAQRWSAYQGHC